MAISTTRREKRLIDEQARQIEATRLLEIGAFKGKTTAVLSRIAHEHDGYVVAIDPMRWSSRPATLPEWIDTALHPFSYERAFWRTVTHRGRPERVWLERTLSTNAVLLASEATHLQQFDFVFIDGEHLYDSVLADFENWGRRVRPGGKVLLHDCSRRFPEVLAAARDIAEREEYRLSWPDESTSLAVVDVATPVHSPAEHGPTRSPAPAAHSENGSTNHARARSV